MPKLSKFSLNYKYEEKFLCFRSLQFEILFKISKKSFSLVSESSAKCDSSESMMPLRKVCGAGILIIVLVCNSSDTKTIVL